MLIFGPDEDGISHKNILDFHQLRKNVFADEYEWDVLTVGNYEFDQYDVPSARYVVAYDQGICVGGARILPCDLSYVGTDGRRHTYMLNDFCHGSLLGTFPATSLIRELPLVADAWELTRFVATSTKATKGLLHQVSRYLCKKGVGEVITISPVLMPKVLKRMQFECEALSEPVIYQDRSYVALSTKVDLRVFV